MTLVCLARSDSRLSSEVCPMLHSGYEQRHACTPSPACMHHRPQPRCAQKLAPCFTRATSSRLRLMRARLDGRVPYNKQTGRPPPWTGDFAIRPLAAWCRSTIHGRDARTCPRCLPSGSASACQPVNHTGRPPPPLCDGTGGGRSSCGSQWPPPAPPDTATPAERHYPSFSDALAI